MLPRLERFKRQAREIAHGRHDTDPPSFELRDRLRRILDHDYVAMSPVDREEAEREIRRLTGT